MQVLIAPSRTEVNKAHERGCSLDIGTHSLMNIRKISRWRSSVWFALGVVATSMHLLWNSTVFSSIPIMAYPVAIVTSDFYQTHDEWPISHPIGSNDAMTPEALTFIYALQQKAKNFIRLSNRDCIDAYLDPSNITSELVMVSSISAKQNVRNGTESSLLRGWFDDYSLRWDWSAMWLCLDQIQNQRDKSRCPEEWAAEPWTVYHQPIQYCLVGKSGDNDSRCGMHFSRAIFMTVAISMLTGAVLLWSVALFSNRSTLVTLGDAQASFLKDPDPYTTGLVSGERRVSSDEKFARLQSAEWRPIQLLWFNAVGSKIRGRPHNLSDLWSYGIGEVQAFALVGGLMLPDNDTTQSFVGQILFVNIFQVLISMIYLVYNNCLTSQNIVNQWTNFMSVDVSTGIPYRKPLRVSSHVGLQRTSYMLSLTYAYAFLLISAFALLHFLVARSSFLVRTITFSAGSAAESHRILSSDASRVGFSTMGIFLTTLTGMIILLALIANSFRRYSAVPKHLPRMANKTAFISAACQRPAGDEDAHLFAVTFMAVDNDPNRINETEDSVKRIVFSTDRNSTPPRVGKRYIQPMPTSEPDDWKLAKKCWTWAVEGIFTCFDHVATMWRSLNHFQGLH
ncbi:hypothetical protein J1614_010903, partial [Plenodomus biglobosus]